MRKYDSLIIYITTKCNRACNGCFVNVEKNYEIDNSEIDFIQKHVGKVNQLILTGGEPTLHQNFKQITESLFKNIRFGRFILATNGYKLKENISILNCFDEIRISEYSENSNSEEVKLFLTEYESALRPRIVVQPIQMITEVTNFKSCGRENNGIAAYYKRKIYGCCVSAGMKDSDSFNFNSDWKENAAGLLLPCEKCVF